MRAPQRPGGPAMTTTRREFLQTTGGALAGLTFVSCDLLTAAPARAQARRREVVVSGKRVKTVDVHAHCAVPEALALMNLKLGGPSLRPDLHMATEVSTRLRAMDEQGIDVEALSINPNWYAADRDLARQIIKLQNEKLAEACAANPERFVAFALSHLIFEGTLDKFPGLKICAAHGGGFLPSYAGRSDHGCFTRLDRCAGGPYGPIKKKPSEYLKQMYYDTMVFTPEGVRHLAAEVGASQLLVGTDYPYPWTKTAVDLILDPPGVSDADKAAMLGGPAMKLLGINAAP